MSTSISTSCSVNELLQKPFSLRSFEEKYIIIKNGKPSSPLSGLLSSNKDRKHEKEYTRHFSERQYTSISGLLDAILEINYFVGLVFYFPKKNPYGIKTDILI